MKSFPALLALPLFAACVAVGADSSSERPSSQPPAWGAAAAKYLDDRMDLWFVKAKKLRSGDGKASCVSCHTTTPYVMARPALRKAAGVMNQTPQETRLLAEALRRVETYEDHEPLYKSKEEQSRGTEAVLNLLILTSLSGPQNHQAPAEAMHKALDELWKVQRSDGAWDWLDFGLEPYESSDSPYYGAAVAAMAVGSSGYPDGEAGRAGLGKLRAYLNGNYDAQNLYSKAWMLLASMRLTGLLNHSQVNALVADLQRQQNADGGWSLYKLGPWTWSQTNAPNAPGKTDLSLLSKSDAYATGLVAYALREAGLPTDNSTVRRAREWLQANQRESQIENSHWDCWRTYSLNYDREHGGDEGEAWRRMFMSDAATAFAALALLPPESPVAYK